MSVGRNKRNKAKRKAEPKESKRYRRMIKSGELPRFKLDRVKVGKRKRVDFKQGKIIERHACTNFVITGTFNTLTKD